MHVGQSAANSVPQLTLITDTGRFSGESFFNAVQQTLQGGADAVLIREKYMTSAKLLAFASRLRQITRDAHARLMIHTQADIATAVDADGVHLASADMSSIPSVRQWLADDDKTISVSCHNSVELQQAHDFGADYAMLSPVFATASHPGSPHLGADPFNALAATAPLPVIALGGIDTKNCNALRGKNMAAISALLAAADPALSARQLRAASANTHR